MTGSWRGVLYPAGLPSFRRVAPPVSVASLVRWFWNPEWHLAAGHVSRQEVISFPACNLVVEPDVESVIFTGPTSRRAFRDLSGHAHLTHDFRAVLGFTPSTYRHTAQGAP